MEIRPMEKPLIGILAGMGPKSTGPFVDRVVSHFQAMTGAVDDIDFPPMMIYSLPTPFYLDQPIDHQKMKQTLSAGLKKLEDCGVAFVAMPCIPNVNENAGNLARKLLKFFGWNEGHYP